MRADVSSPPPPARPPAAAATVELVRRARAAWGALPAPPDRARAAVVAAVARHVARTAGLDLPPDLRLVAIADGLDVAVADRLEPAREAAVPEVLGTTYEALLHAGDRRTRGAFFTPQHVAERIVDEVLAGVVSSPGAARVCDPAVGGGAFLLAAGRWLLAAGASPERLVTEQLTGVDVDPVAAAVTEAALWLLAAQAGAPHARPAAVHTGDALLEDVLPDAAFDAVVGNPPFLNQLRAGTVRPRADAARLRQRLGPAVVGYADTAYLFLLLALRIARPGGRVGLVLPQAFLAARDAAPTRAAAAHHAALDWLWVAGERVFAAAPSVCVPVLTVGAARRTRIRRAVGPDVAPAPAADVADGTPAGTATWAPLAAGLLGVPAVRLPSQRTLAAAAAATADFRDQFYGLVPHVVEGPAAGGRDVDAVLPPLVTTGLIDPACCRWGARTTRFAGRRFHHPRVDLARLAAEPALAAWAEARRVPKVLLATQSAVLEAVVDEHGAWLPCTPTITVTTGPDDLWHVAAVLLAPPVSAWAATHYGGTGLTPTALKLSAKQVLTIPLPAHGVPWDRAAELVRAASAADDEEGRIAILTEAGAAMAAAYGAPSAVVDWWASRLPRRRG